MTKTNKRVAIWVTQETKDMVEEFAKMRLVSLGDAADFIIKQHYDMGHRLEQYLAITEKAKIIIEKYESLQKEKQWWKFWGW